MKRILFAFISLIFLLITCDKEVDRMDDYLVEFVTFIKEGNSFKFRLDDGRILIPIGAEEINNPDGQRMILNYVPLKGDSIKVNYASSIFTSTVEQNGYPEMYRDNPLKLQSVWVSGEYLNLIMEIDYNNKPHSLALLLDSNSSTIDLYLSYSRNDDPPGYPEKMYASFLISSLRKENNTTAIPFKLHINTNLGKRVIELELK